ncbi:MAG: tetratricopeptide repeat protein [Bacteroidales bacterium]|nr:tetratricopeptide repeat protein [Bacteroidales bacterium]
MKRSHLRYCLTFLFAIIVGIAYGANAPISYGARLLESKAKNYLKTKDDQQYVKTLQQGITKYPEDIYFINSLVYYYQQQEPSEVNNAIQLINTLLAKDSNNKSYTINKAILYAKMKRNSVAMDLLKEADLYHTNPAMAWYITGEIAFNEEHYEEAANNFQKAIRLNYKDSYSNYGLGLSYSQQKKHKEAVKYYNKAIQLGLQDSRIYNDLGETYFELERNYEAISVFRKAAALNPRNGKAFHNLGFVYDEMLRYNDAINAFNKAIQIDPKDSEAYKGLGSVYCEKKKYSEAIDACNKAIQIDSKDAEAYNSLGSIYCIMKKYDEAISAFKKALTINPTYSVASDNLKLAQEAQSKTKRK